MSFTEKEVHLYLDGMPNEGELRKAAVELVKHAVDARGKKYRVKGDEVFEEVTEGRCAFPRYSSCGDLPHWMLYRLGVRDERLVNRTDDGGKIPWAMGMNLSRLVYSTGKAFKWAKEHMFSAKPGDILYVRFPEHVEVVASVQGDPGTGTFTITVCDYGQSVNGAPAGLYRTLQGTQKVSSKGIVQTIGGRELVGWVSIEELHLDAPAILEDWMDVGEPVGSEGEEG